MKDRKGDVCVAEAVRRWLRLRWAGADETELGESVLCPVGDKKLEGGYFCLFCETGEF